MNSKSVSRTQRPDKPDTRATPARTPRMKRFAPHLPAEDFPLFPHQSGRWAKKIRGKLHYFGKLADGHEAALESYLEDKDDLQAGRTPRAHRDGVTVGDLLVDFLTHKRAMRDGGELTPRTYFDYVSTCERVEKAFGVRRLVTDLAAHDFAALRKQLAKRMKSPVVLANEITRVKMPFKYGYDNGLIDAVPRYGSLFNKPSAKTIRLARHAKPLRLFSPAQLLRIIVASSLPLRAMILLGANCGFGNTDCAQLNFEALDLDGGWVSFPRPKTGEPRRAKLWPETIAVLRDAIAARPAHKAEADAACVFINAFGKRYVRPCEGGKPTADGGTTREGKSTDGITQEFTKVLTRLNMKRTGLSFYAIRHTFLTIAEETGDIVAVARVMGHTDASMAAHYRERISDDRLERVAEHVRAWLWGETADRGKRVGQDSATGKASRPA